MDAGEQAVKESLWLARETGERAESWLLGTPQDERDAAWADSLGEMVREARVTLRAALADGNPSVDTLAETDQAEMRLRLHGWCAVEAGCALRGEEALPGD